MHIPNARAVQLFVSKTSFVQVYFEAVANAFDAAADRIDVTIRADGLVDNPNITIEITDNGEGFTDEHFDRFARLVEPKDAQHKGLGRLVFLKYFDEIEVDSVFGDKRRRFTFSERFEGKEDQVEVVDAPTGIPNRTTLRFRGFRGDRIHSHDDLRPGALKAKLIEQFFPLLHARKQEGRLFHVELSLSPNNANAQTGFVADSQSLTAADIPDLQSLHFTDPTIDAFAKITILHLVEPNSSTRVQFTAASVDGRTIPMKLLKPGAIPADCTAIFIFESELFSGNSDSSRQQLVLPEGVSERTLHHVLRDHVSRILNHAVPYIAERNAAAKREFEERFPHLIGLFDEDEVGLINRNDAIEAAQARFFQKQRDVLESDVSDPSLFEKTLEVSARSLTEYVLYRDYVIRRLQQTPADQLESAIHELVVPRYETFHQESLVDQLYRNNAWLLDDKFMTFRTILSEARMEKVIAAITLSGDVAEDNARPDISMIFSGDPDAGHAVDVVVVELKRRQVDDKDGPYAATQLAKRAQKLVEHCPNIQRVWYYGIIEIDDELGKTLRVTNWVPLFSKGHVYYQEFKAEKPNGDRVPAPTFLISYEAVAQDAAARNHTFLELLRSGFRQAAAQVGDESADEASVART